MKKKGIARRNFLKYGSAIAAGSIISTPMIAAIGKEEESKEKKWKYIYRKLGNTGMELPVVSMGVMRSDAPEVVQAALKAGIKHFDTAAMYSNGKNEEMLGKVFKEVPRDSFTIATKMNPGRTNAYDRRRGALNDNFEDEFFKSVNGSLERLQMDYVDILYMHAIEHAEVAFDPRVLKVMKQMKDEGKARHLAISTHNAKDILKAIDEKGFYEVVLISISAEQRDDKEYFDLIKKVSDKGVGIVAMKSMMGGFLDKEKTKKVNGKAALKWVMQKDYIHTSIPGMKSFEELEQNISIMENLELDDQEKKDLEMAIAEANLSCKGCTECYSQCKKGLQVPDLMRSYMYAYGYGETLKAQDQFNANKANEMCESCDSCTVDCPKNYNIAERINDIARISDIPGEFLT